MRDDLRGDIVNPDTQHEESDVNVRALVWFSVIFVVFAIVTHLVLWFMFKALVKSENRRAAPPMTSIPRPADASVPKNQPLLQPFPRQTSGGEVQAPNQNTPVTDMVAMRAAEEHALTTYEWVDQARGVVRLPIGVAKQLVVQRGLPVQTTTAPPPPPVAQTPAVQQPVPGGAQ